MQILVSGNFPGVRWSVAVLVPRGQFGEDPGGRMGLNAGWGAVNWRVGGGMGSRATWSFSKRSPCHLVQVEWMEGNFVYHI